ncbi:TIGR01548 family HAD-type hydrolase [Prochlorococcus marinus XMU1411]|uniref:TIGR01548 family HAD-type hydrolase n=1 Tax=Prochlorococcus marinus TaxID=1219 RepID=UPI001AD95A0D|nr:TIGR01548 family HAD-type hydrolase [Prochlorococcus marinus]MBO8244526.1 TIGR01548 family HAD-type hydrolase [Prochlorococcus marinus XMU1411]MBW3055589.1 TIGR01548 family HAD-type hydrolase [Prochlorococcus marinus str. MU1411]MCR8537358.1 TIGR01548 family HAD-type hydrolase [Prochlorococcus marinus CUG1430]
MEKIGLILFDIDGVIRSVENSYRLSLKKTVHKFSGWEPSYIDIDNAKNEGIWNNDWDLSLELIKRFIKKEKLNLEIPRREVIVKCFEKFYFGGDPSKESKNWLGFITNEELLVDKKFFDSLEIKGIIWGFVSGAESASAKFVLEKRIGLKSPPLISMGDAPDKPNPEGLIRLSKKLIGNKLGASNIPIAYVGDTIADINTVINARKEIPSQKFISIGIAPPHLHLNSRLKERNSYEKNLEKAGADLILNSINDLKNINLELF